MKELPMKSAKLVLIAAVAASLAFGSAQAAKPEGKGKPEQSDNGKGNSGKYDDKSGQDNQGGKQDGRKGHDGKDLRYAGISRDDARRYADQYRVGDYKPLPPGIRIMWIACRAIRVMNGGATAVIWCWSMHSAMSLPT